MICTKRRRNAEILRFRKILLDNGYPKNDFNLRLSRKFLSFLPLGDLAAKSALYTRKFRVQASLFTNLKKEVKTSVESCYDSTSNHLVFTSKQLLSVTRTNIPSTIKQSSVMYEYICHCDSQHIGRASQQVQNRIK